MVITEERLTREEPMRGETSAVASPLEGQKVSSQPAGPTPSYRSVPTKLAHGLTAAWLILLGSVLALEPAPSNPQAAVGLWANLVALGFTGALLATVIGLGRSRMWGLRASVWAGGLGVAIAAACAVTDHHPGLWWGYEMVVFAGLTAMSALALRYFRSQ